MQNDIIINANIEQKQNISASVKNENNISAGTTQRGAQGIPGKDGQAATIELGTVSTGAAGTDVIITNSGTSSAAVFNFTIPRGSQGEAGAAGEIVGATAIVDNNTGIPSVSVTSGGTSTERTFVFDFHNLKGEQGATGADGQDGAAATISVGTVSTGAAGTSATVVNSGTSSAAVLDFVIPQGAKGDTGANGTDGTNATITGVTASIDANVGTPNVSVTIGGTESARTFDFAFHNLKGADGQGSGTVNSVNNILPDGGGNVTLTASDVGALPDTTVIPVVDQTYDATSTNAQSGVAVAEAIENNKENFVAEYGVTSFDDIIQAYTDGKTLYCKKIYNIISVYYGLLVTAFGNNPITFFVFDLVTSNYSRERIVVQRDAQDASITNWTSTDYNIPTKTSDLTNDSGFITGINSSDVTGALGYTPVNPSSLATVATSGSYADLTNKPTIPTVNNATLTITQDGVSKGTFTANASSNVTIALDDSLPSQTGHAGDVLTTDGTDASWADTTTVYPVIETYINNGSWYRIYAPDSTGYRWCEIGGLYWNGSTLAGTDNTITFLKNFKDTAYTFIALPLHQDANINSYSMYEKYTLRTVSSTVLRTVGAVFGYEWHACGYIANEV